MRKVALIAVLCGILVFAGCGEKTSYDPLAENVDPTILQPAQGKLSPGVVVYDADGYKLGRVIQVVPDYEFPNGTKGAVYFDWEDKSQVDSHVAFFFFDTALVPPEK